MKVLIVANYNCGYFAAFVLEQAQALRAIGINVEFYKVVGKGIKGYLDNRKYLLKKIYDFKPDLIHAHYGLCGLIANLQRRVPVVTTYHGSDINLPRMLKFSKLSMCLSVHNIFVSPRNIEIAKLKRKYSLIPCGVDLTNFEKISKEEARKIMGFRRDEKLVLFAGAFDDPRKNSELARKAINLLKNVRLLELKGYTRKEVACMMYACDVALMTSPSEGSPQFIKEALVCGIPIVSVDVGDVKYVIDGVSGCYMTAYLADDIAEKIQIALKYGIRTKGREKIVKLGLDNAIIANKLEEIYSMILRK